MNSQSQTIRQHVVDPITLEVIRHGIVSITDQIDANITRTAFSPYIYEYKDFAVGLVGADGELIAQRAQSAGGFRGPGQISRRLGFSQALSNSRTLRSASNVRSVKYPPWGVHGGKEGQSGRITVVKKTGETEIIYKSKGYPLGPGDSIIVETGGGGGYGPPSERARQLIERDLRRGLISAEAAAKDYGVRIESPPCGGSTS
jgi:N-methylhydantoinase B/oxoprolinase/acetone carboxylase alpha subunit